MKEWQTRNLILRPSSQERDREAFYRLLKTAGNDDFRMYTGVNFVGSSNFLDYFRDYMDGRCGRFFYARFEGYRLTGQCFPKVKQLKASTTA